VGKEWENSDYRYPYRATNGCENLDAGREVFRVLRGGAFDCNLRKMRCAYRGRHVLDDRYWDFGCRVVVHPAS
jgi:formylglycine-generating enzyme required for sulfatase activity